MGDARGRFIGADFLHTQDVDTVFLAADAEGQELLGVMPGLAGGLQGLCEIKPRPEVAAALDARFIPGLGKIGDRMLILLDIDTMVVSPDFGLLD